MELLLLPQTMPKDTKRPSRFFFRAYTLPFQATYEFSGFYYIGRNHDHIEKLVKMYERGYASEGIENVKQELLRSLEQEKNVLPEIIVCEAKFDIAAIEDFKRFLLHHPVLNSIPFILDGTGLSAAQLAGYRKRAKPDEILFMERCDENMLRKKVSFLRKIKDAQKDKVVPKIEENVPVRNLHMGFGSKRIFDILVASIALLLLSPVFLLTAFAIRLESKGPVFYISKRAGRGYRIFKFYKFRTMCQDADKKIMELSHLNQYDAEMTGPVFFKVNNDPRVTRIGSILRHTSLDELPQLINVLLGDMSLVGNRPLPLYEAATLTTHDYAPRSMAPAGLTGLWQVKKRGNKDMSVEERINIDIDYATRCSFATDFWIIANTPSALIQKENV